MLSRRAFLHACTSQAVCIVLGPTAARAHDVPLPQHPAVTTCAPLRLATLAEWPIGEAIALLGRAFLQTPYTAGILDQAQEEHLVTDVGHVDCATFIENTLALARSRTHTQSACEDYQQELLRLRYRHGILDGYASRLHYVTDWLDDNQRKGIVKDITQHLGGIAFHKTINFMSTHRHLYPPLADDALCARLRAVEASLSARTHLYIPQGRLAAVQESLEEGDLIALTASRPGLDVAHMGIAVREAGTVKLVHASKAHGCVVITPGSLAEYVMQSRRFSGMIVARALEPTHISRGQR